MEVFYRTHKYLVDHVNSPVRRELATEINWDNRLIGIKGSRGVGKTTFLLQYAKDNFGTDRSCLYINLNNFYFTERSLVNFADEFRKKGGKVLLIDQVFKYSNWSQDLKTCHDSFDDLKIIFSGSSVMRLKEENPLLSGLVDSYNLRGFSFREFVNLMAGTNFPSFKLENLINDHEKIASMVCEKIKPLAYFQDYLHHGFYPFFLEKRNFSENLIKTMNMMLEVDVLFLKQIELSYLPKVRKLLYLLSINAPCTPNVSQLSKEIQTSRATVLNYINYLKDARLINMLYPVDEEFPKKPARVYMNNTNLMYPLRPAQVEDQAVRETFFYNILHKDNRVHTGEQNAQFLVNQEINFRVDSSIKGKVNPKQYYAIDMIETGNDNIMPLWLFGFLY